MVTQQDILIFWFGDWQDDIEVIRRKSAMWWSKDETVDDQIRERFGSAMAKAEKGHLDHWQSSARGALAFILLTDQFPRNCHRDSAAAFACDHLAQRVCEAGLAKRLDTELRPVERVFFYMPLEHAESLKQQERSVELFRQLQLSIPEACREDFRQYVDFAERHHDIIRRFGRFPHRNSLLNRESTPAEQVFLQQPGSSF